MYKLEVTLLVALLVAVFILMASTLDYQDQQIQELHYKNMVCAGHWPDYKKEVPACE